MQVYVIRVECGIGKKWILQAADPNIKPMHSTDNLVKAFNEYVLKNNIRDAKSVLYRGVMQQETADKLIIDLHFDMQE